MNFLGLAHLYQDHIWKLNGLPNMVISDCGPQFALGFMKELDKILGMDSAWRSSYEDQKKTETELNCNWQNWTFCPGPTSYSTGSVHGSPIPQESVKPLETSHNQSQTELVVVNLDTINIYNYYSIVGENLSWEVGMWPFKYLKVSMDHLYVFVHSHTASGATFFTATQQSTTPFSPSSTTHTQPQC